MWTSKTHCFSPFPMPPKELRNPTPEEWNQSWTLIRLNVRKRRYSAEISAKLEELKTILSWIIGSAFIGLSIWAGSNEQSILNTAIWFGSVAFFMAAIGICAVLGTNVMSTDALDDFCQLEDLYHTFKNQSEEEISKTEKNGGKVPVELSFPSRASEGANEIDFPVATGQPSKQDGLTRFEVKHGITLEQVHLRRELIVGKVGPKCRSIYRGYYASMIFTILSITAFVIALICFVQVKYGVIGNGNGFAISLVVIGILTLILMFFFMFQPFFSLRQTKRATIDISPGHLTSYSHLPQKPQADPFVVHEHLKQA